MKKAEFLASLTPAQREEFNTDIENLIIRAGIEYDFDSSKVAEVNTNMRLQNEIYLNVTLVFHVDDHGQVTGEVSDIKKFNTVDEYLDAINAAKNPKDDFKNIKM